MTAPLSVADLMRAMQAFTAALFIALNAAGAGAETLTVAVASNFSAPMQAMAASFSDAHGDQVRLVNGSSGKLYAQIRQGAPYDAFFSADQAKPSALTAAGLGHDQFTYAEGQLVLWSARPDLPALGPALLRRGDFNKLAIANPKLAPYGLAATQTLSHLGLNLSSRLVQGENIAQTYQFVATGNADVGFVAASQVLHGRGSAWRVPAAMHAPILQDAVNLAPANATARRFIQHVQQQHAVLANFGYRIPGAG